MLEVAFGQLDRLCIHGRRVDREDLASLAVDEAFAIELVVRRGDDLHVVIGVESLRIDEAREGDRSTVRRPRWAACTIVQVGHAACLAATHWQNPDLWCLGVPLGDECYLCAIGRPAGRTVVPLA